MTTWGIVSMVRGPADDILRFAAHHLDLGANFLYIYMDEPNRRAFRVLRQHPKIRVRICDDTFWQKRNRNRPEKHQIRQTVHATFTYRNTNLDWLAHIDVDEFLWSSEPIADLLQTVPADKPAVRVRPIEALAGGEDLYKAHIPNSPDREALVEALYPNYGAFVQGGFLSHVQGKLFVRTGLENLNFRIHNLFQNKKLLPCKFEVPQIELCHRHAPDWGHWAAHYQFRMDRGSYQPDMSPNVPREQGGLNKNELHSWIEAEHGLDGLRAFYDEMSGVDPAVRARLQAHGLIKHRPLHLDEKVAKHFPGSG
ncbi:glycosyltransferase family 2 protein [Rhodobacteraceae bacterium B1Z28]|uniref:Glycosyltransferase family 2 protein n=1 Tax=Ruegeria haliotis TaxID=2747601 RepID=A0ABX2PPD6_9RHOB|nr:glycosyltransferase family 2 protein [Ruegeria haliotis]NVO55477.1 glycosyltransferase family 2 protein [Ruegeria haliotis]